MEYSPNLSASLTVRLLTLTSNLAPDPLGFTYNLVLKSLYPIPPLITTTSSNPPPDMMGLNTAPVPSPSTVIVGTDLYPSPLFKIWTSTILPLEIMGDTCAFLP